MAATITFDAVGRSGMSYGGMSAGEEQERPLVVEIGASLLAILGLISVGRVAYGVLMNLGQDGWDPGSRLIFLVLNSIVLVFALFILVLAYHVRRGRFWAWIVSIVMLPFTILFGGMLLLITILNGAIPVAGIGVLASAVAALVVVTVPRTFRAYFLRKPAPLPAGAVPGYPWGPGQPPA
jgi:hypothetical protein